MKRPLTSRSIGRTTRAWPGTIAAALTVAGLAGACGTPAQTAQGISANTAVQQDTASVQKIVQGCITAGSPLTKTGRTSIMRCIAPPGHLPAFESCAQAKVGSDGFLTSGDRTRLFQDWAVCLQNNR